MYRQLASSLQKGPVQFFYKKAFASDFVQGTVQNLVSGGFHGKDIHFHVRMILYNEVLYHLALKYGKLAFPAADHNFITHNSPRLLQFLPEGPALFRARLWLFCGSCRWR